MVNTRAIDLTEALLLLSRTDQRSFTENPSTCPSSRKKPPKRSSPSPKHFVTLRISADVTPTTGSRALLLQLTTDLVHKRHRAQTSPNTARCRSTPLSAPAR